MERLVYIAHYETGFRPRSHWEEKKFYAKWEAERLVETMRKEWGGGGYVSTKWEGQDIQISEALQKQISSTVERYASSWNGI